MDGYITLNYINPDNKAYILKKPTFITKFKYSRSKATTFSTQYLEKNSIFLVLDKQPVQNGSYYYIYVLNDLFWLYVDYDNENRYF